MQYILLWLEHKASESKFGINIENKLLKILSDKLENTNITQPHKNKKSCLQIIVKHDYY